MNRFSESSKKKLETCETDLQRLFTAVLAEWDCTIVCGHRGPKEQNEYFNNGKSKVKYPNSKHNPYPSKAVDVAPYPIDWNDLGRFYMFAGYVMKTAKDMGIKVRYGGDWDGDRSTADQTFHDLPHWELLD